VIIMLKFIIDIVRIVVALWYTILAVALVFATVDDKTTDMRTRMAELVVGLLSFVPVIIMMFLIPFYEYL